MEYEDIEYETEDLKNVIVIYTGKQEELVHKICEDFVNEGGSDYDGYTTMWYNWFPDSIIKELQDNDIIVFFEDGI